MVGMKKSQYAFQIGIEGEGPRFSEGEGAASGSGGDIYLMEVVIKEA